jgi:hypothetical protein
VGCEQVAAALWRLEIAALVILVLSLLVAAVAPWPGGGVVTSAGSVASAMAARSLSGSGRSDSVAPGQVALLVTACLLCSACNQVKATRGNTATLRCHCPPLAFVPWVFSCPHSLAASAVTFCQYDRVATLSQVRRGKARDLRKGGRLHELGGIGAVFVVQVRAGRCRGVPLDRVSWIRIY